MSETAEVPTNEVVARDYFAIGKFQKKAESIDPDKTHPWTTVHYGGFLAESGYGAIAVGETYDSSIAQTSEGTPFGLLISEKTNDGLANSVFDRDLDQDQRGYVMDAINTLAPSLPDESRHQFIRRIIQEATSLKDEKVIAERLARMGLELIPDYIDSHQTEARYPWPEIGGKIPTPEQQSQLAEFTRLAASKMPSDGFAERMHRLQDNLRFTDDPYGRNYQTLFTQMAQWVLDEREDTKRNYDILQREKPEEFTIKDKVTRPVNSEDELKAALSSLPVEPIPDTRGKYKSDEIPEIVQLERVVGGTGIETWSVSTSEGRGLSKIFEFTRELQNGNASVTGRNKPIRLIEVGGKYYVDSEGRHRTAALKALGVVEVPAMVIHIK